MDSEHSLAPVLARRRRQHDNVVSCASPAIVGRLTDQLLLVSHRSASVFLTAKIPCWCTWCKGQDMAAPDFGRERCVRDASYVCCALCVYVESKTSC